MLDSVLSMKQGIFSWTTWTKLKRDMFTRRLELGWTFLNIPWNLSFLFSVPTKSLAHDLWIQMTKHRAILHQSIIHCASESRKMSQRHITVTWYWKKDNARAKMHQLNGHESCDQLWFDRDTRYAVRAHIVGKSKNSSWRRVNIQSEPFAIVYDLRLVAYIYEIFFRFFDRMTYQCARKSEWGDRLPVQVEGESDHPVDDTANIHGEEEHSSDNLATHI